MTGVMIQGRGDGQEWVTSYVVSYSLDAYTWKYAADFNGNRKVSVHAHTLTHLLQSFRPNGGENGVGAPSRRQRQVSAAADRPARRGASLPPCCTQMSTGSV